MVSKSIEEKKEENTSETKTNSEQAESQPATGGGSGPNTANANNTTGPVVAHPQMSSTFDDVNKYYKPELLASLAGVMPYHEVST